MLFTKVETFGTQKSAMPLSFSNFDFLLIYKADSAGSQTQPFVMDRFCTCIGRIWGNIVMDRICYGPNRPLSLRHNLSRHYQASATFGGSNRNAPCVLFGHQINRCVLLWKR